jgi:pimeloyl-ACP methyl ester carboxylesterase
MKGQPSRRSSQNVTQPTLVVCGMRHTVAPPALGRHYRELIPRCHFVMMYDAGHVPWSNRREAFAQVVSDYVQRLEAFVLQRESGMLFR